MAGSHEYKTFPAASPSPPVLLRPTVPHGNPIFGQLKTTNSERGGVDGGMYVFTLVLRPLQGIPLSDLRLTYPFQIQLHRQKVPRVKEESRRNTIWGIAPWPDSLTRNTRGKTHTATIHSASKTAHFLNPLNILQGDPTAWKSNQRRQKRKIPLRGAWAYQSLLRKTKDRMTGFTRGDGR